MSALVTINGKELSHKTYNDEPFVTLTEIDLLHEKNGSAKRNFNYHKDRFVEGIDYYLMPLAEYRKHYDTQASKSGNPNIDVALITETGYLLLAKTFNDDLAWDIQRALVNNYFRVKKSQTPTSFSLMRQIIDTLEQNEQRTSALEHRYVEMGQAIQEIGQIIKEMNQTILSLSAQKQHEPEVRVLTEGETRLAIVERKYDKSVKLYSPTYIAKQLKLFTRTTGNPHSQMINAIAKMCGIPSHLRTNYEDEDVVINITNLSLRGEPHNSVMVEYKKPGLDKILKWFTVNSDAVYFETYRKVDRPPFKAGQVNARGYRVGNKNYYIAL